MALLLAAMALVIASHVVPSAPGVRERLIGALGRSGFYVGYSLVSLLTLGLLIWSYRAGGAQPLLYGPSPAARIIALAAMPVATFLVIARLTTGAEPETPRGIYRLSAAPGSLGVLLWALLHLLNLGEARQVAVFAGMALLAATALVKHLRRASPACRAVGLFRASALGQGRFWRELGWRRPAFALLVYLTMLGLHPVVIGRDPLAGAL